MIRLVLLTALAVAAFAVPSAVAQTTCIPGVSLPGCEDPEEPPGEEPPAPGPGPAPPGEPPPPPPEPPPEPPPSEQCDIVKPSGRGVFSGLVAEQIYVGGPEYRRCALSEQARAGVRILRQPFRWHEIETGEDYYYFDYMDAYVGAVAQHGIEIMPILFDPPAWRSGRPQRKAVRGVYPPKRNSEMAAFAARVVQRYGTKGSFWSQNPLIPKVPIRYWQIWNEPNYPYYWPPKISARQYVRMQRKVGKAIRRTDRRAKVVTAGLPHSTHKGAVPLVKYVKAMYKAGARKTFNILAVNAYARSARELLKRVRSVRKVMRRNKDKKRKIWVTELGWATDGPRSRFNVGPEGQARLIGKSFNVLKKHRRKLGIAGLVYYNWQDAEPYDGFDFWGLHTGLLDIDGNPKPGLVTYSAKAARANR